MANNLVALTPRERWVHYSSCPDQIIMYDTDYSKAKDEHGLFKPIGLWITPYGQEDNWFEWSMSEEFRISELNYIHDVEFAPAANILRITSVEGIDAFAQEYAMDPFGGTSIENKYHSSMYCDWPRLAQCYDGIIISPYQWERRLMTHGGRKTDWYYSWDCASGCIWNARAIESIKLRSNVSAGYIEKPRRSITEMMTELNSATEAVKNANAS
jgi:hypothetical protein